MLSLSQEIEIEWLRRQWRNGRPLSIRAIARLTGVSRGAVERVVRDGMQSGQVEFRGPVRRCKCGALAEMPCRACRIRSLLTSAGKRRVFAEDEDDPLRLELRPEEHARYLEVQPRAEARASAEK